MIRTAIVLLTAAAMVIASAVTVRAQGRKGSAPKPTTRVSSPKPNPGVKKTTVSNTSSKGPKTTTARATKTAKTSKGTKPVSSKSAKGDKKKTTDLARSETRPSKTEKTTTTTASGDGNTAPLSRVQEKLQKNTKLAEKLEGRLPSGTDLMEAAEGFRNLGQFVAAVNVSNNLALDFDLLKTAMVDDGKSLGQAIQLVKKDVESPTLVAQRAEADANTVIQETERQSATTTVTTTTKKKSKEKPKRTLRTQGGS